MICEKCGHRRAKDKACKFCKREKTRRYSESFRGMVNHKYRLMIQRARRENHITLEMSFQEFLEWSMQSVDYMILHTEWQHAPQELKHWLKPSVDRLDNSRGYRLDNIRWVTWKENYDKEMNRQRLAYAAMPQAEPEEIPDYL